LNVAEFVLETKGKRGMTLHGKKQFWTISADEVEVYNVSGAGDTVIAVMATALSMGWNPLDSAYIANKCASYVVTKPGTSTVPKSMFMKLLKEYKKGNY
jgi:D-beta-D-heptose 7-phosphate kinase/D-beta-D-heptose 1-phosphate adenosyltransferase